MTKFLFLRLFIFCSFVSIAYSCTSQENVGNADTHKKEMNSGIKEIAFENVVTDVVAKGKTTFYEALIRFSDTQGSLSKGIELDVELKYSGEEPSQLHNPIYYFQYLLKTNDVFLNTNFRPPIPFINRKDLILPQEDFNFNIIEINRNGEPVLIEQEVNTPIVRFKPKDKVTYKIRIADYKAEDGLVKTISSGFYELVFKFSLNSAEKDSSSSRILEIKNIAVSIN